MYSVTVRSHIMIAHSLKNEFFGPAQGLHGATYVVDATFLTEELNEFNVVIDIGEAHRLLEEILESYNYKNLDEMKEFQDVLTTTEFMARQIHDELKGAVDSIFRGRLRISLGESHVAWASYEG